MPSYITLKTSELRVGMRVNVHGAICLIDREIKISHHHYGHPSEIADPAQWTRFTCALVIDGLDHLQGLHHRCHRDENDQHVRTGYDLASRMDAPRWSIQGNDFARWSVLVDTASEYVPEPVPATPLYIEQDGTLGPYYPDDRVADERWSTRPTRTYPI